MLDLRAGLEVIDESSLIKSFLLDAFIPMYKNVRTILYYLVVHFCIGIEY